MGSGKPGHSVFKTGSIGSMSPKEANRMWSACQWSDSPACYADSNLKRLLCLQNSLLPVSVQTRSPKKALRCYVFASVSCERVRGLTQARFLWAVNHQRASDCIGLLHANYVRDPAGRTDCGIASSPLARVDTVIVFLFPVDMAVAESRLRQAFRALPGSSRTASGIRMLVSCGCHLERRSECRSCSRPSRD